MKLTRMPMNYLVLDPTEEEEKNLFELFFDFAYVDGALYGGVETDTLLIEVNPLNSYLATIEDVEHELGWDIEEYYQVVDILTQCAGEWLVVYLNIEAEPMTKTESEVVDDHAIQRSLGASENSPLNP